MWLAKILEVRRGLIIEWNRREEGGKDIQCGAQNAAIFVVFKISFVLLLSYIELHAKNKKVC